MSISTEEIAKKYNIRPFIDPEKTRIDVDSLVLDSIDISLFKEGDEFFEQRKSLAKLLEKSITTYGFFNLVNFGIEEEKIDRLRAISQSILTLPYKEKLQYLAGAARKEDETTTSIGGERGQGFKPKGYWEIKNGIRDSIDHYNFRETYKDEFLVTPERHPDLVAAYLKEIASYFNQIHRNVLPKLLRLCDLILDIPEGTLWEKYFHNGGTNLDTSKSHGRLMLYQPYANPEYFQQTDKTYLRGHSDISAFSFITSQPILALQVKDYYSGIWRYVNHRKNSLIVNVGDALEFITGGFFKACLHRVVEPPEDQRNYNRLVIIYFCNPNSNSELDPELLHSRKLDSLGYSKRDKLKNWEKIHFQCWNDAKGKLLGRSEAGERNLLQLYGRFVERWHHFEGN